MTSETRTAGVLEWPLALLSILVIPAIVMERAESPPLRTTGLILNWVIWLAFVGEFIVGWRSDRRPDYPRRAWFDLLLILIAPPFGVPDSMQGIRSLRVLRLLRLLRAFGLVAMSLRLAKRHFGRRQFHYVALVGVATVVLGAVGIFLVERGENKAIAGLGDALWWAIVTATTVGYGDVSPVTLEGRLIAVALMLTGIGIIGVFTATVASMFLEQDQKSETAEIAERLDGLERKLDELLRRS